MPKFYITGLYHTEKFNDATLPPIEVEVERDDRILALASIGATVWSEDEFRKMRERSQASGTQWPEPIKF